jgi:sugar phosphate permease
VDTKKINYKSHILPSLICFLGTLFYFYEYFLRVAPGVLRPELKLAYNLSEAGFGFLVGLYYWTYVPLQLIVGIVIDLVGPRIILTMACLVSAIGTYFFAGTEYLLVAQIGRSLVGFGAAFAYVGILKLVNIWLPKKYFAFMAGFCSTLGMLGGVAGQVLIARFSDYYDWRDTLISVAIIGFIFTAILWLFVKDENNTGETSYRLRGILMKLDLLWVEIKEIIILKDLWINGLIGCFLFAGITVFADTWAVSFLEANGISKELATLSPSMVYIGFGIGAPIWGMLSDIVVSRKVPLILGSLIGAILISLVIYFPLPLWLTNVLLFLFGLFVSVEILVFAATNDLCSKEVSATAVGLVNMFIMMGGLLLQPRVGAILDYLHYYENELLKFKVALSILPIGLLVAGFLSSLLKDKVK